MEQTEQGGLHVLKFNQQLCFALHRRSQFGLQSPVVASWTLPWRSPALAESCGRPCADGRVRRGVLSTLLLRGTHLQS